jgi:hypothetical protein
MTNAPAQPGSECAECRKVGRFADARKTITDDHGARQHLCYNHAAAIIHQFNLYDFAMNPTGNK